VASKSFLLSADLHDYIVRQSRPAGDVLDDLAEQTRALGGPSVMQIAPEEGAFLEILTAALGARNAVEVGTFTGYSSTCIARGLGDGGTLLCCDVNEEWTAMARRAWERAGVASRITLRLAPAVETLRSLPPGPQFDLAFIDADKPSYRAYAEELIPRLRPNGVLLVDNVLWGGSVADPAATGAEVESIRAFNDWLAADPRVECVVLPVADGLTLARRR
jgi:caffeoyl-CoA O-methyltransferase